FWRCGCGLVLLHPVPAPEELPAGGEWWSLERKRRRRNRRLKVLRQKLRTLLVGGAKERLAKATAKIVPGPARCLDVGCGAGTLLEWAKRSFECVGVEPSPVAAEEATRRGFEVIEATFEDAEIVPASFDVVFMDSVIEHVRSPRQVLAK